MIEAFQKYRQGGREMELTHRLGCYELRGADTRPSASWKPRGAKTYATAHVAEAIKFFDVADAKTRAKLTPHVEKLIADIGASTALDGDISKLHFPKGLLPRPYQAGGVHYALGRRSCLNADAPRLGKAQPLSAKILTPTGWKTMGDMYVGAPIIGSDGKTYHVTGVFPQGVLPVYRVATYDGRSTRCSDEHLFTYKTTRGRLCTRTVEYMRRVGLHKPKCGTSSRFVLPYPDPIVFAPAGLLEIPPYVLGVLIGDGYLSGTTVLFSAGENKTEIVSRVRKLVPGYTVRQANNSACPQWCISQNTHKRNDLLSEIRALGLAVNSKERYIPEKYMFASIADRLELIRGLMDTDGSCRDNRTVFHTCSQRLARDVVDLVRSLGGCASLREYDRVKEGKSTEYQVRVNLAFCPFRLTYKARSWRAPTSRRGGGIVSITPDGEEEQQCISTSAPDRLYVTDDFILTHNTVQSVLQANTLAFDKAATSSNNFRWLIVCPANAKIQWYREVNKWRTFPASVKILQGTQDTFDTDVVIMNWELVPYYGRELLNDLAFDFTTFDEAHRLRHLKSQTTTICLGKDLEDNAIGADPGGIKTVDRLFLTGTPIFTKPVNIWPLVRACDPNSLGRNFYDFGTRYCGAGRGRGVKFDPSGGTNLDELQIRMRRSFMVRRERRDVAGEIPSSFDPVVFPRDSFEQLLRKEASELRAQFSDDDRPLSQILADRGDAEVAHAASSYEALSLAKLPLCIEHITPQIEAGEKVVIFAHHRSVLFKLREAFEGCAFFPGGLSMNQRQHQVDRFREDDSCRVVVAGITAAGEAISFAAANISFFVEIVYSHGAMEQAEERIVLPEKTDPLSTQFLIVEGSADEAFFEIRNTRRAEAKQAVDAHKLVLPKL